ncbi:fructose bisphosphate aldolase [Actinomyces sp. 432]|uniref:fructose bisphosphate aldolase n=1 Tax=Actinomyces sp. 432 TaxID=2057798 RepID=UPI00137403F8|nr:fructose bisphosphate aldolase [Actinomyces sp. 432]QHO90126.1 fructose bisphosphate aldolase [Actinomyces sp. 432]
MPTQSSTERRNQQMERIRHGAGFIAALDQSGGSTPRALKAYGIEPDSWNSEEEMFELVHTMRTRVMTSPAFTSERVLATILFERTLDSEVEGRPTADYLWDVKGIVPFLKVDKGLEAESHGARVMKPIPRLDETLAKAVDKHAFGTKMRSVILHADTQGVAAVVDQQFEIANQILDAGLTPIIEPEVDINAPDKTGIELLLLASLSAHLDDLREGRDVVLKLTIPSVTDFYHGIMHHPRVARVAALSGGYTRAEANRRLARNRGLIASFSRALLEGLDASQTQAEFDAALEASIAEVYRASTT